MRRLVRELRPRYVVVENVAALLDRGLGRVLGGLADSGYDAEWCCFPTGRPMGHDRERVFIVAYPMRAGSPERRDTDTNGPDEARFFTRERFAGGVEGIDPRQVWTDRPLLGRGIHGISRRVDRVKAIGNSIVPQIAEWIARRILDAETARRGGGLTTGAP
jgi:DNA (cytosine-5)-methyltransferase 1